MYNKYVLEVICTLIYIIKMDINWHVHQTETYQNWFDALDVKSKEDIMAIVFVLSTKGPSLGRPYVDSVKDSRYKNMKELRVQSKLHVYRIFFAFAPNRAAILLIGDDKRGDKDFYKRMISLSDKLFTEYLLEFHNQGKKA